MSGAPNVAGSSWTAEDVRRRLRRGRPAPDAAFDQFLPDALRFVSGQFWTPLEVVARAAEWLREHEIRSVVDIGSGVGKVCVAGALATECTFTGIEERPHLVATARALARTFGVEDRVSFIEGAFGVVPTPVADAYYLYNPFGENLFGLDEHLDEAIELSERRYASDLGVVRNLLLGAKVGTHLLTYNGFGGRAPASYKEVAVDRELPNVLRMWRKQPPAPKPPPPLDAA